MPLKLISPKAGRSPNWRVRGTYLGVYVDRSAQTGERKVAARLLGKWKNDIERGAYAPPDAPTFASASVIYMNAGGERRFLTPLIERFGARPLFEITQELVDLAAVELYPKANNATRNRQVYTPVSAVLKRAGVKETIKRPSGAMGTPRMAFLTVEQAFALFDAARAQGKIFGALCTFLLYTGVRLSEALRLKPADLELKDARAWCGRTKNGDPLAVHLPPVVVAALANLPKDGATVFGLTKCGDLYDKLNAALTAAGIDLPPRLAFHIFRHTFGAWMRRYAGLDTTGLVATKRWKSRAAAAIYEHADVTEESRKADLLPVGYPGKKQSGAKR